MKFSGNIHTLNTWRRKILDVGITDDLSFEEKKKTRLLNLVAIAGFPGCLTFAIVNSLQLRYPLVAVNILMAIGCLAILFINKERKYLLGRFFLSIISIAVFTIAAIFYKNGAEYFLLLNIVATVILFKNTAYVISLSAANVIIFIIIKILHPESLALTPVPYSRVIFNIAWTLFFIILALHYYKSEHLSYQNQIENSNKQLTDHQEQLLRQKDELEKKSNQLEILNHTKEKLFSVIAHDMRTPIAGLKSTLELYQNQVISKDEFDELTGQLATQVDNLYSNLDNLLQWSYSQLNGIQARPESTPLKPLVLQTISLLLQNAKQKQLQIEQKIPENLAVFADPNHTKVVMRNLLSNAIKFSHISGTIEIVARQFDHHAEIHVKDNGVGMNQISVTQLFKTDINHTERGTQNEKGTGLGLTLCKEFIEKNNGQIAVRSEEGKGTCFTFSLPLGTTSSS